MTARSSKRTRSRWAACTASLSPASSASRSLRVSVRTRRAVADVLRALTLGGPDALLLLANVRHIRKKTRCAGRSMVPEGCRRAPTYPCLRRERPDPIVRRRHLAASAAIFGVATGLSRVLGLVREIVARRYFGVQGEINAFTVAFQVPNLVRALVADSALSAAFVPVFSELLEKGEKARAWRVASTVFWLLLLGLTGITALLMLLAPWVIAPVRAAGRLRRPRRHALADPLPDRRPARRLGRDRRDPQQLRAVLDPRADPGVLEPRDHHRARRRRAAGRLGEREALRYAGSILVGTIIQVLLPSRGSCDSTDGCIGSSTGATRP